jgi:hypothetical protein
MNHNFADFELTLLLPNIKYTNLWDNFTGWCWCKEDEEEIELKEHYSDEYELLAFAWTWEDIRLYLESKGYEMLIDCIVDDVDFTTQQVLYYYRILLNSTYEIEEDFTYYNTYEEARRKTIIHCLNLINNENNSNS